MSLLRGGPGLALPCSAHLLSVKEEHVLFLKGLFLGYHSTETLLSVVEVGTMVISCTLYLCSPS